MTEWIQVAGALINIRDVSLIYKREEKDFLGRHFVIVFESRDGKEHGIPFLKKEEFLITFEYLVKQLCKEK